MPIGKEETDAISAAVAGALKAEFEKVLTEIKTNEASAEAAKAEAAAKAEEQKLAAEQKAEAAAKTESTPDIAELITQAVKDAVSASMSEVVKRVEALETKETVETQQATEATATVEKKKSLMDQYKEITDPAEKSKARKAMLAQAMFGPLKQAVS